MIYNSGVKYKFLWYLLFAVVVVVAALDALLSAVIKLLNAWYYRVDDPVMRKLRRAFFFFKLPRGPTLLSRKRRDH